MRLLLRLRLCGRNNRAVNIWGWAHRWRCGPRGISDATRKEERAQQTKNICVILLLGKCCSHAGIRTTPVTPGTPADLGGFAAPNCSQFGHMTDHWPGVNMMSGIKDKKKKKVDDPPLMVRLIRAFSSFFLSTHTQGKYFLKVCVAWPVPKLPKNVVMRSLRLMKFTVFEFSGLLMRCGMGVKTSVCLDDVWHLVAAAPHVVCCE